MSLTDKERDDLEHLQRDYRDETDAELDRKRDVVRSLILNKQDLAYNEERIRVLSSIIRFRRRQQARRAWLQEATGWTKLLLVFIGGLVASPFAHRTWDALVEILND